MLVEVTLYVDSSKRDEKEMQDLIEIFFKFLQVKYNVINIKTTFDNPWGHGFNMREFEL